MNAYMAEDLIVNASIIGLCRSAHARMDVNMDIMIDSKPEHDITEASKSSVHVLKDPPLKNSSYSYSG